jgi:hypothetical protein
MHKHKNTKENAHISIKTHKPHQKKNHTTNTPTHTNTHPHSTPWLGPRRRLVVGQSHYVYASAGVLTVPVRSFHAGYVRNCVLRGCFPVPVLLPVLLTVPVLLPVPVPVLVPAVLVLSAGASASARASAGACADATACAQLPVLRAAGTAVLVHRDVPALQSPCGALLSRSSPSEHIVLPCASGVRVWG